MATKNHFMFCGITWLLWINCHATIVVKMSNDSPVPETVNVIELTTLHLYCSGSPNLKWIKDGDSTFEVYSGKLTFESIQLVNGGTYKCKSLDINEGVEVIIQVLYPAPVPKIDGPILVMKDETFTLNCSADSNPKPSYRWTFDWKANSSVATRGRQYSDIMRMDELIVYCFVENTMYPTIGQARTFTHYNVAVVKKIEPVYIWELFNDYEVAVGTDLSIVCKTTGSPSPTVWWSKDGDPSFRFEGERLFISNVQIDFSGYYSCHARNVLQPSGKPVVTHNDVKHTRIIITDPTIPAECRQYTCSGDANETKGDCPVCQDARSEEASCESCSTGVIAAAVVGWILAGILIVTFIFCCIRHKDSGPPCQKGELEGNDNISFDRRHNSEIMRHRNEERLATRPVLPVRPDVSHRPNDDTYSYISGGQIRNPPGISGKYDYIDGKRDNSQHYYLELEEEAPRPNDRERVGKTSVTSEKDEDKIEAISNPTSSSTNTRSSDTEGKGGTGPDGYLTSIKYDNKE